MLRDPRETADEDCSVRRTVFRRFQFAANDPSNPAMRPEGLGFLHPVGVDTAWYIQRCKEYSIVLPAIDVCCS